jgi:hypothetical protein
LEALRCREGNELVREGGLAVEDVVVVVVVVIVHVVVVVVVSGGWDVTMLCDMTGSAAAREVLVKEADFDIDLRMRLKWVT